MNTIDFLIKFIYHAIIFSGAIILIVMGNDTVIFVTAGFIIGFDSSILLKQLEVKK